MTATTHSAEDEPQGQAAQAPEADGSAGTAPVVGVSVGGDRCAVCGAELAQDQRYCVECGTRRGAPRFSAPLPSQRATAAVAAPAPSRRPSRIVLIAAIATLLIAFGVGVLIGHYITNAQTVNVHLTGSGSGASSAGSGGSSSSGSGGHSSGGHSSGGSGGGSGSHGSGGSGGGHSGNFFP